MLLNEPPSGGRPFFFSTSSSVSQEPRLFLPHSNLKPILQAFCAATWQSIFYMLSAGLPTGNLLDFKYLFSLIKLKSPQLPLLVYAQLLPTFLCCSRMPTHSMTGSPILVFHCCLHLSYHPQ